MKKIRALLVTPYHEAVGDGPAVAVRYAEAYPNLAPTLRDIQEHRGLYTKLFALQRWALAEAGFTDKLPSVPDLYERYYTLSETTEGSEFVLNAFAYTVVADPPQKRLTATLRAVKGHLWSVT